MSKNIFNTYSYDYINNNSDLQYGGYDEDGNMFWTDDNGKMYYQDNSMDQFSSGGGSSGDDSGGGAPEDDSGGAGILGDLTGNGGGNAPAYNYNSGYSPGNYGAGSYGPQNVGMGNYGPLVNPYGPVVNPSGVLTSWPGSQNNVFGGAATYNGSMPGANDIPQTAGPDKYSQQSIQLLALSNDRVQQAINSGMAVVMSRDNVVGGNPVQKSVVLSPGNPGAGIYTVGFSGPLNTDGTLIPNQAIQYTYPALPGTADSTDVESTGGDGGASGSGSNDCDCGGGTGGASGGSGGASGGGGTGGPSGGTGSDTTGTGTGQTPSVTNTNTTTDASTVTTNDKNPVLSSAKTVTHKKPATASKQQVAPKYFYDPNYTWVGPNEYVDHSHSPQSAPPNIDNRNKISPNAVKIGSVGKAMQHEQGKYNWGQSESEGYLAPINRDSFKELRTWSDQALLGKMEWGLSAPTWGELNKEAENLINHFKNKSGADYISPVIARKMAGTEPLNKLSKNVTDAFKQEMQRNKGNYNNLAFNRYKIQLPNWSNISSLQLLALVGGTQQVDIYLNKINYNNSDKTYDAEVVINLIDTFGVDEDDTKLKKSLMGMMGTLEYLTDEDDALKAMWILQHERGYSPFRTIFQFKIKIHGKY